MRALLLVLALLTTSCAAHRGPQSMGSVWRVWLPLGMKDDVTVCVALPETQQWSCHSLGEIRQMLETQGRL